jgi:hypothetical protein
MQSRRRLNEHKRAHFFLLDLRGSGRVERVLSEGCVIPNLFSSSSQRFPISYVCPQYVINSITFSSYMFWSKETLHLAIFIFANAQYFKRKLWWPIKVFLSTKKTKLWMHLHYKKKSCPPKSHCLITNVSKQVIYNYTTTRAWKYMQ